MTNSSKLVLIDKLLKQLHASGHKVLLFSQMTTMLDILQDYMDYRCGESRVLQLCSPPIFVREAADFLRVS